MNFPNHVLFVVFVVLITYGIKLFLSDTRDGTVPRVGRGKAHVFGQKLSIPASSKYRPYALNLYALEATGNVDHAILLLHGTCSHGGVYGEFAEHFQSVHKNFNIYGLDLQGHGETGKAANSSGRFKFENWINDVDAAAKFIRLRLKNPIKLITIGMSMGGETSYYANTLLDSVDAGISMNIMLFAETNIKPIVGVLKGPLGDIMEKILGELFIPIWKFFDFQEAYDWYEEPSLYEGKIQDPLQQWYYGFASYRSVFTYKPPHPASENQKPVLVIGGLRDLSVPPNHMKLCYDRIGGPKNIVLLQNGRHQVMGRNPVIFAEVVHSWIDAVFTGQQSEWKTPHTSVPKELKSSVYH